MGKSCISHRRSNRSTSTGQYPNVEDNEPLSSYHEKTFQIDMPCYIVSFDGYQPHTEELSSKIQTSACTDVQPLTTPGERQVPNHYNRTWETSLKIDAGDLPTGRKVEESATIAADDNTIFAGKRDSESNIVDQQSEKQGLQDTKVPSEIIDQLRRLKNTNDPETNQAAEKLLDFISKLPNLESSKPKQSRLPVRRSLDLDISRNENRTNITGKLFGSYDNCDRPKASFAKMVGRKPAAKYNTSKLLGTKATECEQGNILKDDEEMKDSNFDIIEFSKQQVIETDRKSLLISETLDRMQSLTVTLATSRRNSIKDDSTNDGCVTTEEDPALESLTSKIDELDKKIEKSMQKITRLRRQSLDLFADQHYSSCSDDEEGKNKNLSLLFLEKEIHRWQDQKNKLADEREKLVTKLQSKLVDKISSTPVNVSPKNNKDCPPRIFIEATEQANALLVPITFSGSSTLSNPSSLQDNRKVEDT